MTQVQVSVIIAAHNTINVIGACLAALIKQIPGHSVEVIVAEQSSDGTDELIRTRFPEVRLLHFAEPLTVPQLRGRAIALAQGQIIAIIDPFSVVAQNWLSELLRVHAEQANLIIGGAVELYDADNQGVANWATYINEYGGFMLPLTAGVVNILPGSNISYKREAIVNIPELESAGFWKAFVNWDLEAEQHQLWLAPSLVVYLLKPIPFTDFLRTRYHHGRCYAGMRVAEASTSGRWFRAFTTPLLPILFMWRLARLYWPKQRHRAVLLKSIPLQVLLFSSWAYGELWGYLRGSRDSCEQLFY